MGKLSNYFKKAGKYIWENILFIETLFLLAFIPLYPKLPLLDIKNTWVYIRADDFAVLFVILTWFVLLIKNKVSLKTPLTIPIIIFWLVGVIATIHGVLLVFPTLANEHPNVAFLTFLRHIEYVTLFFVAFSGIKNPKQVRAVITVLVLTLIGVIVYGFGQKYLGFPAYLTMNEEFAKGVPITLSGLSRIPSTFAGHYDLAAYLVLIIPLLVSLIFGVKNYLVKGFLLLLSLFGLALLFMTVSRVSFFVLFIGLLVVLFFQKRKLVFLAIPLLFVFGIGLLTFKSSLLSRFESTVATTDVLIDAQSGDPVGNVKFVPKSYFADKLVLQRRVKDKGELARAISGSDEYNYATASALLPQKFIPAQAALISAVDLPTGEDLPQGTGYVNLTLSPVVKRVGNFFYELPPDFKSSTSAQVLVLHGDFIVKRVSAYDLSFTTRFQGEWPNAISAFTRNIIFGSGYSSVTLAVDNNYLRMLAETGLLGFLSFVLIFLIFGIYTRKIYPDIDSKLVKSFIIGVWGGIVGLFLNAVLIDVFEASKIAYLLWMLVGVSFGLLLLYQTRKFDIWIEVKRALSSTPAIFIYLFVLAFLVFSPSLNNFFVGDDFTWLRWVADCKNACSPVSSVINYFTQSNGFFYRPGTKIYFDIMYHIFWLNQVAYHFVSLLLHFGVAAAFYVLAKKVFKSNLLGALSAVLFVVLSGSTEMVLWIASTGSLFTAFFGLLGLLSFISWREKRNYLYLIGSVIFFALAPLFHELGIVLPLLVPAYLLLEQNPTQSIKKLFMKVDYLILFIPAVIYLILRFLANSHWSGGDYSYNLIKLPFNVAGNLFGYLAVSIAGPMGMSIYQPLREHMKSNLIFSGLLILVLLAFGYLAYRLIVKILSVEEKRIIAFSIAFFVIALLPFLGLGNIASRYSYMASLGVVLIIVLIIRKTYGYFEKSGREIVIGFVSVGVLTFILFHIISIQQAYFQWNEAGTMVTNFFVSTEELYDDTWSKTGVKFHFVGTPVQHGQAWVFPVGLTDAVWFAFKNPSAQIYQENSVDDAMQAAGLEKNNFILEFNEDGSVKSIDRSDYIRSHLLTPSQ